MCYVESMETQLSVIGVIRGKTSFFCRTDCRNFFSTRQRAGAPRILFRAETQLKKKSC